MVVCSKILNSILRNPVQTHNECSAEHFCFDRNAISDKYHAETSHNQIMWILHLLEEFLTL